MALGIIAQLKSFINNRFVKLGLIGGVVILSHIWMIQAGYNGMTEVEYIWHQWSNLIAGILLLLIEW